MNVDVYQKLIDASFRFVSFRPRSEKEIKDFLQKKLKAWKVYAPNMVEKVVTRLRELDYIDDQKFIRWWVEQRSGSKPKGKIAIIHELLAKGIDKNEILKSTDLLPEKELALRVTMKKIDSIQKLPPVEQKQKIFRLLASRGFSHDVITSVIDDILDKRYNSSIEEP